jgi:hypothetical protein
MIRIYSRTKQEMKKRSGKLTEKPMTNPLNEWQWKIKKWK